MNIMLRTQPVVQKAIVRRRCRNNTLHRRQQLLRPAKLCGRAPHHHHHRVCYFSTIRHRHQQQRRQHQQHCFYSSEARPMAMSSPQQQQHQQSHDEKEQFPSTPKEAPPPQHVIVNNINNWLAKDPNFLKGTMECLNLNVEIMSNRSRDPSGNHPFHIVWKQYQQLFTDTIPIFCNNLREIDLYLDGKKNENDDNIIPDDDSEKDRIQRFMSKLADVGFDDHNFGKRFRQYRGYNKEKAQWTRRLTRLEGELQHRGNMLRQEQDKLMQLVRKEKDEQQRLLDEVQQKKMNKSTNVQEVMKANQEVANASEESSVLSSILSFVKSFSSRGLKGEENQNKKKIATATATRTSSSSGEEGSQEVEALTTTSGQLRRVQNRIVKKKSFLKMLEKEFRDINKKVTDCKTKISTIKDPMSEAEYRQVQKVVEECTQGICQEMANQIQSRYSALITQCQNLDSKTDLTKPHEWYPYARLDQRKIIFHGGPTNSGKTYAALQRLKEAKNGLYLGPLRLLAAEIYEELTSDGLYTNLYTGQEKRDIAFSTHASATVEMCSPSNEYDVVVIDEIQMISDGTRGAAWTKALLSVRSKEIHVCGGLEAKKIVEKIANTCGDEFELNTYERFSPLHIAKSSISNDPMKPGCYKNVQPGDCIVAFSRNDIFAIKREIERTTNYKCCVVYGRLPPAIRAEQARRFNDPDSGYDILVASDAIGMGLNLNIKRIVFNTIFKFNGESVIRLSHSEVKQISGRAGRRNSPYPNGEVTCRDPRDLHYIQECMSTEIQSIDQAALLPTADHIEFFSQALYPFGVEEYNIKEIDLYQILRQFNAMAIVKGDYFLGRQREMRAIAKRIKDVPLTIRDSFDLCLTPANDDSLQLLESFAVKLSRGEVSGLSSRSVPKKAKSFDDLSYLCNLYADADMFLWLQNKFPSAANAVEQQAAVSRKEKTMDYINEALSETEKLRLDHCYVRASARQRSRWEAANGPSSLLNDSEENDDIYENYGDEEELSGEDDRWYWTKRERNMFG